MNSCFLFFYWNHLPILSRFPASLKLFHRTLLNETPCMFTKRHTIFVYVECDFSQWWRKKGCKKKRVALIGRPYLENEFFTSCGKVSQLNDEKRDIYSTFVSTNAFDLLKIYSSNNKDPNDAHFSIIAR